jgi:hypothetical protein
VLLGLLVLPNATMAQTAAASNPQSADLSSKFPIYDPYPPGILPRDLNSELTRVLREVDFIEERALAQWRALTPPVLTRSRASK